MDDDSTKTYLNQDVVFELGIEKQKERVEVNVMNGRVESFEIMIVSFDLENVTSHRKMSQVEAFTIINVTGTLKPV